MGGNTQPISLACKAMNLYNRYPIYFLSIPIACMLLILVPGTDSGLKTADGIYGETTNFIEYISIDYPQFSLRFIEKKALDKTSPEIAATYSFQIAYGSKSQQVDWQKTDYRMNSFETFTVGNQKYFIDLKRSDFMDKSLANEELVVWTSLQHEQFERNQRKIKRNNIHNLNASEIEHGQLQTKRETSKALFETYKGYLQALNMAEEDNDITNFLSDKNPLAQPKQVKHLYSRHNPELDLLYLHDAIISPHNAKLYLSASSTNEESIIGVQFIKQQGKWKIVDEKFMPDNSNRKEWIKHFMQLKQETTETAEIASL